MFQITNAAKRSGACLMRDGLRRSAPTVGSVRHLDLHEYQSKEVMEKYNVRVQKGGMAETAEQAVEVAKWIKSENPAAELIVKGQIHAGGRGKGHFIESELKGGVKICEQVDEVAKFAPDMLGNTLVTHQTGPAGQMCNKLLINEGVSIASEKYFAILMDRSVNGPCMVGSHKGGMDIEAVAEENPDDITTVVIDPRVGMTAEKSEEMAKALQFEGEQIALAQEQITNMYDLFIGTDATQVEINPFAVASIPGGDQNVVMCVDAKLNFDDNAAFRQREIYGMRDTSMEDPRDVKADEVGLNYIGLDGNIGCMVNGAGLAMATMDIIKLYGGEPANFLDVGGGANAQQVAQALEILTDDPNVQAIMVNIFGGIMRCDTIAEGICEAVKTVKVDVPLVVRLEGTNVEKGMEILRGATGVNIITADDLDDAAKKAVAAC